MLSFVLLIMVLRDEKFFDETQYQTTNRYNDFFNGDYDEFWNDYEDCCSDEFKDLFQIMFNKDPNQRASLADIEQHPWLQKGNKLDDNDH